MTKKWLITLVAIILATDAAILLDIPFLRQLLAFLCFTIIPGFLILQILKLEQIGITKKFLLSVGLSLSFLLFVGLLINVLLPLFGYSKPLSTNALVACFSPILIILCLVAYWRNREGFYPSFDFLGSSKNHLLSPLLFPLLFPLLSILGSHLMNTAGNNTILIGMLSSILIYAILLPLLGKKVHPATYPLAIWMMSIALLLMAGMMSNYPTGGDVYREFYAFKITSNSLSWRSSPNALIACLSSSLLPTIYYSLLGVSKFSIVKIIYPLIASLIPLTCYVIYKNYMTHTLSFLASFFFIAQIPFIYSLKDHMRIEICLLFFALFLLLIFENEIRGWKKNAILITFLFSIVVTYYAFPVLFFYLLLCLAIASRLLKSSFEMVHRITGSIVALCIAAIFLWWSQLTAPIFDKYIAAIEGTFLNLSNLFADEFQCYEVQAMTTMTGLSFPATITRVVHDLTFVLIAIGVIALIIKALRNKQKMFDVPYIVSMTAMTALAAAFVLLPYISTRYSAHRIYLLALVVIAPALIIGVRAIFAGAQSLFQRIRSRKTSREWHEAGWKTAVVIVIVLQFLCATGLLHQVSGIPFSEFLNTAGARHGVNYVYDLDVIAAGWLYEKTDGEFHVAWDWGPSPNGIFLFAIKDRVERVGITTRESFVSGKFPEDSYIFLRTINVKTGLAYTTPWSEPSELTKCAYLFDGRNKIYAGGAEVYK